MRDATNRQLRTNYIRCSRCNALVHQRVYADHDQAHRQTAKANKVNKQTLTTTQQ